MEEEKKEDTTSETNETVDQTTDDIDKDKDKVGDKDKKKSDPNLRADAFYGKYQDEKKLRESLEEKLKAKTEDKLPALGDIEKIAQVTSALSGLDKAEQGRLIAEAKMKGISLSEAKKDEDFLLWKKAHIEKVELEKKELTPSTKQPGVEEEKPLSEMTIDEKDIHFQKLGLIRKPKSYQKKWQKK